MKSIARPVLLFFILMSLRKAVLNIEQSRSKIGELSGSDIFLYGITEKADNILRRLLSIFTLAYSGCDAVKKEPAAVSRSIFSIAAIRAHERESIN